jgi:hypothetical protein
MTSLLLYQRIAQQLAEDIRRGPDRADPGYRPGRASQPGDAQQHHQSDPHRVAP